MKYVKLTLKYLKKNILIRLLCFAFFPAVAISFTSSFSTIAEYFTRFKSQDRSSFIAVYRGITEISLRRLPLLIIALILFSFIVAIMVGIINKHMRTGNFSKRGILTYLNENILPSLIVMLFIMVAITVMGVFVSLFVFMWSVMLSDIAALVLSLISLCFLFLLLILIFCFVLLWCPAMVVSGKRIRSAIGYSFTYVKKDFWRLFVAIILPLIPAFAVIFGLNLAGLPFFVLKIIDAIVVWALLVYYPSLMFVAYYDLSNIERADVTNVFNW